VRDGQPKTIYLKDYRVPAYLIEQVSLCFELDEEETLVRSRLKVTRNPASHEKNPALVLHGHESLELQRICINGQIVPEREYQRTDETLTIAEVPDSFTLNTSARMRH